MLDDSADAGGGSGGGKQRNKSGSAGPDGHESEEDKVCDN